MGWCYAPYIAQETSNFITREIGYAWVDNFIVGGTSLQEFKSARTKLRERIARYDILVDDDSLIESQHPCMLGIEFDLVNKKYRLEPAWIAKKTERLQKATQSDWTKMSYRDIFETLGALIWATYVANTPLWSHAEALGAFSTLAQKVQGRWDDQAEMPSYANSDVAQWAATVLRNDWCYQTTVEEQYQGHVFSDASTEAEAFVLLQGEFITQAAQWNRTEENHIFLAETHALCEAFKHHGKNHLYHTDNLPLHWSIQKRTFELISGKRYPASNIRKLQTDHTMGQNRPKHF